MEYVVQIADVGVFRPVNLVDTDTDCLLGEHSGWDSGRVRVTEKSSRGGFERFYLIFAGTLASRYPLAAVRVPHVQWHGHKAVVLVDRVTPNVTS